jgi:uncharacterized protein YbaR (Trm112 family)
MHIELTEMLRCPEAHPLDVLVLSTGEMIGRMVRSGVVGCPVCGREYRIVNGVVDFSGGGMRDAASGASAPAAPPASRVPLPDETQTLQALLDLSGPGGFVVLLGAATRHAPGLAGLMGGIHFVGVDPPTGMEESLVLSLVRTPGIIPLRPAMARGVVAGGDRAGAAWLEEAQRVLLRGRRFVVEREDVEPPAGINRLAAGQGLWAGEKGLRSAEGG